MIFAPYPNRTCRPVAYHQSSAIDNLDDPQHKRTSEASAPEETVLRIYSFPSCVQHPLCHHPHHSAQHSASQHSETLLRRCSRSGRMSGAPGAHCMDQTRPCTAAGNVEVVAAVAASNMDHLWTSSRDRGMPWWATTVVVVREEEGARR